MALQSFDFSGSDLEDEPLVAGPSGARARVLIADDNDTNRRVLAAMCELFGCASQVAKDGVEAVEAFADGEFDLVLMDVQMPRMDGVEATRAIRQGSAAGRRAPILAVTANTDSADVRRYLAAGMAGVVAKPIEAGRLLEAMTAALAAGAAADFPALRLVRRRPHA